MVWAIAATLAQARGADQLAFGVTLDVKAAESVLPDRQGERKVNGRLYVFLSQRGGNEPMQGPNWFQPEPFLGLDVRDVRPGQTCMVDDTAAGFPTTLAKLPVGKYRIQAVLDHDFYCQHQAHGVGNFYSDVTELPIDPAVPATIPLLLDKVVEAVPVLESDWVHEIALPSTLLAQFFGREVIERATVVLPAGYDEHPERRYPVIYEIPGFGGTHRPPARYRNAAPQAGEGEADFIRVLLSGNCKWGHHVYADSATNGPRGATLVRDMIPHVDANFRTIPQDSARFATGHSSGGWASLWLQVNYPDTFGGCWSTSPDPVDFHDFQLINLYANPPENMYVDPQGQARPIARRGTEPFLFYSSFAKMDDVLGRGGQLRSFEAVFSALDTDGLPRRLWDRQTGQIDSAVAKSWEKYDIRLVLQQNWSTLGPQLAGKLNIITGALDTFYLDGATRRLKETLHQLGSDVVVEIQPGKGHSDILTADLGRRIRQEMSAQFRKHHPD
jgi:S-formylglutathione hydrolase FrmB